jgi:hypothetical protein
MYALLIGLTFPELNAQNKLINSWNTKLMEVINGKLLIFSQILILVVFILAWYGVLCCKGMTYIYVYDG